MYKSIFERLNKNKSIMIFIMFISHNQYGDMGAQRGVNIVNKNKFGQNRKRQDL